MGILVIRVNYFVPKPKSVVTHLPVSENIISGLTLQSQSLKNLQTKVLYNLGELLHYSHTGFLAKLREPKLKIQCFGIKDLIAGYFSFVAHWPDGPAYTLPASKQAIRNMISGD
jgi:hypothetical protein